MRSADGTLHVVYKEDVPGTGFDAGASDIILTPLGDFALATSPDGSQVATGGDFTNFHFGTVVRQ